MTTKQRHRGMPLTPVCAIVDEFCEENCEVLVVFVEQVDVYLDNQY
jgi:hypothetical protein